MRQNDWFLIVPNRALYVNLPGLTALLTICCLCGCVVFAEYKDCDPIQQGRIQSKDQLLPLYVMDRLHYPGLPGLFTACLFSGALRWVKHGIPLCIHHPLTCSYPTEWIYLFRLHCSTISSGLNSLAAVTLQDFVKLSCFPELSEQRATLASKIIGLC